MQRPPILLGGLSGFFPTDSSSVSFVTPKTKTLGLNLLLFTTIFTKTNLALVVTVVTEGFFLVSLLNSNYHKSWIVTLVAHLEDCFAFSVSSEVTSS
jgi:hypothetical protein